MTATPTGQVLTVRGPVDPSALGQTLSHEHIFIDLRRTHLPYRRWVIRAYGGPGYAWVLERFLPRLRADGIPESAIQAFMVGNPARLLTFAAPAPAG